MKNNFFPNRSRVNGHTHSHLQQIVIETAMLIDQVDGTMCHRHRHKFIQNITANDGLYQRWRPQLWHTLHQWFLFRESFDDTLAAPNAFMRFARKYHWQRNILYGTHFTGLRMSFVLARSRYVIDCRSWRIVFRAKFEIFRWQLLDPFRTQISIEARSVRHKHLDEEGKI